MKWRGRGGGAMQRPVGMVRTRRDIAALDLSSWYIYFSSGSGVAVCTTFSNLTRLRHHALVDVGGATGNEHIEAARSALAISFLCESLQ